MKRILLTGALALLCMAPAAASAQVSSPYVNVLCVVNPLTGDYTMQVYRQPGSNLVHTITDPAITTVACTNDAQDLLNWVHNDLVNNGTWNGNNDQLEQGMDIFCPGPDDPTTIASLMANMSTNTQSGHPQAGLVINYFCPTTTGGGGGTPPVTAEYTAELCEDGHSLASSWVSDPNAINMVNVGPSATAGFDTWELALFGNASVPGVQTDLPSSVNHCSQDAADAAQAYLQANVGLLNPHDFGVDAWQCPVDDLVISVTHCDIGSGFANYGYRVDCCPPQIPPNAVFSSNTMSTCIYPEGHPNANISVSLAFPTYFMSPMTPIYNDPNTVCVDLEADALAWFDANLPSGSPPCSGNWGAAAGGDYVSGTFSFANCGVTPNAQQCGKGGFQVRWRQQFACVP